MKPAIFTIPAGVRFAQALAAPLIRDAADNSNSGPESLAATTIFLPTRRGCRALEREFLAQAGKGSLLLPRLRALGDIDDEDFWLSGLEPPDIPPAIAPLRRQGLLTNAVMALPGFSRSIGQACALACALAALMDRIHTEELSMDALAMLAPENFAEHWNITLEFLGILAEQWPKILAANGVIDAADRRRRITKVLAEQWRREPPTFRIIAAGTTGSIPATESLLQAIAYAPHGKIVLPGLDRDSDEDSWQALQETHPQWGLKQRLKNFGIAREQVADWPGTDAKASGPRRFLAREIMRPAATLGEWTALATHEQSRRAIHEALKDVTWIEAESESDEAATIALLLRETLETPGRSAALVTPDRALARRVAIACKRWNIRIDDSAGTVASALPAGQFLQLCLGVLHTNFAPVPLLALLKHNLCGLATAPALPVLERCGLRGIAPREGLTGLRARLAEWPETQTLIEGLAAAFRPLTDIATTSAASFADWVDAHVQTAEALATAETLWHGETGRHVATGMQALRLQSGGFPLLQAEDYAALFAQLIDSEPFRPAQTHPRAMILGQIEARMIDADRVIMAGLNEGVWPAVPDRDPWMSRPMKAQFGLPTPDQDAGLAAHDFVQGFCARDVVLIRAHKTGGVPAIPSRWLQRLDAVLQAAQFDRAVLSRPEIKAWLAALDRPDTQESLPRPAPCPPRAARPRRISASKVETWIRNPYGIYAYYVLGLRPLDPPDKPPDTRERGNILHQILRDFIRLHPDRLPHDGVDQLCAMLDEALAALGDDPAAWALWRLRFPEVAQWFLDQEKTWREEGARPAVQEKSGAAELDGFRLEARADRLDLLPSGAAIIDYKSGGSYTGAAIASGASPQLPVEAVIAAQGGFGPEYKKVAALKYLVMSAGRSNRKAVTLDENIAGLIVRTEAGLRTLIQAYDNDTAPYHVRPRAALLPQYDDYEHLARVREWGLAGDAAEDAA